MKVIEVYIGLDAHAYVRLRAWDWRLDERDGLACEFSRRHSGRDERERIFLPPDRDGTP